MKKLSIVVAVFAFFAMTAVTFAANTAIVNITSEPIKEHAICDKAGGFAITFDHETTFTVGDQITFDLPLNVYICKQIDMRIGVLTAGTADASGFAEGSFPGGVLPTLGTPDEPLTGTGTVVTNGFGGITFLVTGNVDTARVTINIQGDRDMDSSQDSIAGPTMQFFGNSATPEQDVMELAFLDQQTFTGARGIFKPTTAFPGTYGVPVLLEDNTFCIDVEEYDNETVNVSFDSKNDKYTWQDSHPQVAHVVAGNTLVAYDCEKKVCGRIEMPGAASQGGSDVCGYIDNEAGINLLGTNYASTGGYCNGTHRNNKIIIRTNDGAAWDASNYSLTLTILVNGAAGDNGVYWLNQAPGSEGYDTPSAACADLTATANAGVRTLYNASDAILPAVSGTHDNDCTIATANRAVKMHVAATTLGLNQTTNDYAWIDLPSMQFDRSLFQAGDVLEVRVQIDKAPCGEIFDGTFCIGTAGCETVATSYCLRYPYFGKTIGGAYLSAIVVDNLGSTSGTVTLTMYEQDGDVFTSTAQTIDGYSMMVKALLDPTLGWTGGPGTVGDAKAFVTTQGTMSTDGCALITNATTGESISYLPRMTNCSTGAVL